MRLLSSLRRPVPKLACPIGPPAAAAALTVPLSWLISPLPLAALASAYIPALRSGAREAYLPPEPPPPSTTLALLATTGELLVLVSLAAEPGVTRPILHGKCCTHAHWKWWINAKVAGIYSSICHGLLSRSSSWWFQFEAL